MPCEPRCICAVCTCGRHKLCQPLRTVEGHLDTHTEYCDNYKKYQVGPRQKGQAAQQQLSIGGDFSGSTENREKYKSHPVPAPPMRKVGVYHPNDGAFSSQTTQRMDYPAWPGVAPPAKKERPEWVSTSGPFEGSTTNKSDYKDNGVQPRWFKRPVEYVKSDAKFEGSSTQSHDYQSWPVPARPGGRHAAPFIPAADDRDFKCTTSSTYLGAPTPRHIRTIPTYLPPATKFEGASTQHTDYTSTGHAIPRVSDFRPRADYVPHADDRDFTTTTRSQHSRKEMARCPAEDWKGLEKERHGDGHMYLATAREVGAVGKEVKVG